jgi:hypothetical protein
MEGRGGGEAQGVADQKTNKKMCLALALSSGIVCVVEVKPFISRKKFKIRFSVFNYTYDADYYW